MKGSKYWSKQPTKNLIDEFVNKKGEVKSIKSDSIPDSPERLPDNLFWKEIDILDENQLDLLFNFLLDEYSDSEDDLKVYFDKDFIRWALGVLWRF